MIDFAPIFTEKIVRKKILMSLKTKTQQHFNGKASKAKTANGGSLICKVRALEESCEIFCSCFYSSLVF